MRKKSTGVYFQKKSKRYIAKPWIARRAYYIGSFQTEEEAEKAVVEFKEKNSYLKNYDSDMDCGDPYLEMNKIADTRKLPLAEIKIRCAIVQQSIDDIKYGSIQQKMMAALWMMENNPAHPFSFTSITDLVGIDGNRVKNEIFKSFDIKEEEVISYVKELLRSSGDQRATRGSRIHVPGEDDRDSGSAACRTSQAS
jgi:hypothetical protein